MGKHCKVCHCEAELDENGRCRGCADAKRALDLGTSYGKLKAGEWDGVRYHRELPTRVLDKYDVGAEKTCPVCKRTFRTDTQGKKYCSMECQRQNHYNNIAEKRAAKTYAPQPGIIRETGKITVLDGTVKYVRMARTLADCTEDRVELIFATLRPDAKWMAITAVKREGIEDIWYIQQEKDGLFAVRKKEKAGG